MVVSIRMAFPSVPNVQSALCPGVTRFHLLCYSVSVRRYSAVLVTQLATSVCEPGNKHHVRPSHDRWDMRARREAHLLPVWLPFPS